MGRFSVAFPHSLHTGRPGRLSVSSDAGGGRRWGVEAGKSSTAVRKHAAPILPNSCLFAGAHLHAFEDARWVTFGPPRVEADARADAQYRQIRRSDSPHAVLAPERRRRQFSSPRSRRRHKFAGTAAGTACAGPSADADTWAIRARPEINLRDKFHQHRRERSRVSAA